MKNKILQSIAVLTVILVGGFWSVQKVHAERWEYIGKPGFGTTFPVGMFNYTNLAFNKVNSEPYVAFIDYSEAASANNLKVMRFSGGFWQSVDNSDINPGAISFAFNPQTNEPYVAYTDISNASKVVVQKFSGGSWQIVGDTSVSMHGTVTLAFNPKTNEPFLVIKGYEGTDSSLFKVKVIRFDSSSWQEVGSTGFSASGWGGSPPLVFLPSTGEPYIAYNENDSPTSGIVKKFSNSSWQVVGSSGFDAFALGDIHLAFHPFTNELYVGSQALIDGAFKATVVKLSENSWQQVGNPGLGVASSSTPFIAFHPTTGELYAAYNDAAYTTTFPNNGLVKKYSGDSWQIVGSPELSLGGAYFLSLAFHPTTNEPYVGFYDTAKSGVSVMKYTEDGTPPLPERKPALYGLFIGSRKGVKNGDDFRADIAASNMLHAFNNLSRTMNVAYARSIEGDFDTGGITRSEIYSAIKDIKSQIHSGDIFFFYINAHGGNELLGTETTKTIGDEYLEIAPGGADENSLTDDELFQMMQGMDDVNKWIIVDACHSGGFWANNNQNDQGDLEKLKNAAFIAAAEEDKLTGYSAEGISALSMALTDGLSIDAENKIKAAKGGDILTLENLYEWAADWKKNCEQKDMCKFIYEMEFGDSISPSEVSNFIANKTDDFQDGVDISKLQDPDTSREVFPVADGNGPYEGSQGQSVHFDASKSYDEDGTIFSYQWDWNNDGSYDNSSSSPTIEHTWNNPLSEGIVGLQVTDNNGLSSTDKILVNISSKTICSSMKKNKGLDIFDTFKLNSNENENVIVKLRPDENGEYTNGGAAINLWSGLKQFKKEKGTLPIELNAILPKFGWHDLSIFSHGKNGFNGAYCITVESSGDAWKTLKATKNVE